MPAKIRKPKDSADPRPVQPDPAPEPEIHDVAVPDFVVDEVYAEIRSLQYEATVALAAKIGGLLVARFFAGDLERARSHGAKDGSLRKLALRFEFDGIRGTSASALSRAIAIYALDLRIGVATKQHLTASHVHVVLSVADEEKQNQLLTQADERGWSVVQLREKAAAARKAENGDERRGRPPLPAFVKTANLLSKLAREDAAFGDMEELEDMDEDRVRSAYEGIVEMRERLEGMEKALRERLGGE